MPAGRSRICRNSEAERRLQLNDITNCSCMVPGPEYYQSGGQEPNPLADPKDADNARIAITWNKVRLY